MAMHILVNTIVAALLFAVPHTGERSVTHNCCGTPALAASKHSSETATQIDSATARQLFERFKKFEGKWIGRSTKGWTDSSLYKVIAAGSVFLMTSFDAHPNETMLTLMHFDVNRLLITHYCVAKNQPRLVATKLEENGNKVTFEYLDGTGLSSRDKGHMDKAIYRFIDEKSFSSQWTWYQKGAEQWMEEIVNERVGTNENTR